LCHKMQDLKKLVLHSVSYILLLLLITVAQVNTVPQMHWCIMWNMPN